MRFVPWLFLLACRDPIALCTDMGCEGSLTITFDQAPAADAVITIDLGDGVILPCDRDDPTRSGECWLDGTALVVHTPMGGEAAAHVFVMIDDVSHQIAVTWDDPVFPNGEDCDGPDGGCRSGTGALTR